MTSEWENETRLNDNVIPQWQCEREYENSGTIRKKTLAKRGSQKR